MPLAMGGWAKSVRGIGQYVTTGTQLMSLVPDEVWIIANFKKHSFKA